MVHVQVVLVRARLIGDIPFAVDTGAERSLLGYDNADEMGVDYDGYGKPDASIGGIGGDLDVYDEEARLTFRTSDGSTLTYETTLQVASRAGKGIPSLLGLDVLRGFRMVFDWNTNEVALIARLDWR